VFGASYVCERGSCFTPSNEYFIGITSFMLEIQIALFSACFAILMKTIFSNEGARIDFSKKTKSGSLVEDIEEKYILPIKGNVEFIFDKGSFYNLPSILESTFKWSEFDREEFFLVHAGALDQPKLTLKEVQWSESGCKMILGMASFHDVFFTNYSPDLVISTQPSNEGDKFNRHTVRSIIGRAIEESRTEKSLRQP
jgi:hypothetical protein